MFNKLKQVFYLKQLKYGLITISCGLIPVILIIILFQLFLDITPYKEQLKTIKTLNNYDIKLLIYYLVSGFSHIIICGIIIGHFFLKNKNNKTPLGLRVLKNTRLMFLLLFPMLVYVLDRIHLNLAFLSHDRLYIIMSQSDFFKTIFKIFPKDIINFINIDIFKIFSILPFILIYVALIVMIYGSFFIGKELYLFLHVNDLSVNTMKESILNIKTILKKYSQLLSIVLVSSTIATILFFLIPIPLIADPIEKSKYLGVSISMGVCWGVVFSLTLLFLCVYPYSLVRTKLISFIQENRIKCNPELEDIIEKYSSFYSLMFDRNFITSMVFPALASILSAIVTSSLI